MTVGPERSGFAKDKDFVNALLAWIVKCGADWYYDEEITQLEHAVQRAALARLQGGDSADITAALLHDVGHFLMQSQAKDKRFHDRDLKHEIVGANWLARAFCPQMTEPVRLHVPAKRYLCAVDPGYRAGLSDGSKTSPAKQDGPLSEFVWHEHKDTDETFLVIEGSMSIEFKDRVVELNAGEMIVVKRGEQHKPFAAQECKVMIIEPENVVNTGESGSYLTAKNDVWI